MRVNAKAEAQVGSYFYLNNGRVLKSVGELRDSLMEIDDSVFTHHVNQERNDFSNWIRDVFGDEVLGNKVKRCKSRDSLVRCLDNAFSDDRIELGLFKKKEQVVSRVIFPPLEKRKILQTIKESVTDE